ncbi:MAG: hypothetical protein KDB03_08265 [Planctomycetales bacterium]|nr:hypothetical protein [Planctomycetales bacterium]
MTILHHVGDVLRGLLAEVPLYAVRLLFVLTFLLLLVWVIRLPKERTQPPNGARRWDENLKLGAVLALLLQIIIYSLL